jgi:hypothetical protein
MDEARRLFMDDRLLQWLQRFEIVSCATEGKSMAFDEDIETQHRPIKRLIGTENTDAQWDWANAQLGKQDRPVRDQTMGLRLYEPREHKELSYTEDIAAVNRTIATYMQPQPNRQPQTVDGKPMPKDVDKIQTQGKAAAARFVEERVMGDKPLFAKMSKGEYSQ